jgi:hypothetical protein
MFHAWVKQSQRDVSHLHDVHTIVKQKLTMLFNEVEVGDA